MFVLICVKVVDGFVFVFDLVSFVLLMECVLMCEDGFVWLCLFVLGCGMF